MTGTPSRAQAVKLSRQQILDVRQEAVARSGLQLAYLEQLEQTDGVEAVTRWLEDHNFWDLAENWRNWRYLLGS